MQLDIGKTRIDVAEEVTGYELNSLLAPHRSFKASLDGESIEGHTITMSREATTPDGAIKSLFDAMTAAGVTL